MLKLFDPLEYFSEQWQRKKRTTELLYYASELMERLGFSEEDLSISIDRALQVCFSLDIPVDENFEHIYRADKNELISDWKLSRFACYLLCINADPINPTVAKAQLYYVIKTPYSDVEI